MTTDKSRADALTDRAKRLIQRLTSSQLAVAELPPGMARTTVSDTIDEARAFARAALAASPGDPPAGASREYCERAGGCVCGGDLPRVREGCSWWAKSVAAPEPAAIPAGYALVQIQRSYDMRMKALIAFNTTEQAGKDRDDALDAAHRATLEAAPRHPATFPSAEG
ncbi:hypothetical protein [Burkholderia contaminans]|uniref:hypothetical protein n=1 Tax=Burkholderia contaminans TaxID=488447 RepID=UPI0009E3E21C|nr:hypothetical protein [Burkholderia contaminans]MEB4632207.1 hypothetical protein [Burkholderia contaminans]MEB4639644.1 hypothetical protein [Burkholderia contaminans]MEB4654300.1 hypothetical protein [Burkholderia contaminans]MEB4663411.1 hypothetical protein [Burkholderia contaminans]MEB4669542.1 hypothetical protein [Burkholderia contaminans]